MFKIFHFHFQCQTLLPWLRFSITVCLFNSTINNICALPLHANVLFRSPLHLLSEPSPPASSCTILHSISLRFYPPTSDTFAQVCTRDAYTCLAPCVKVKRLEAPSPWLAFRAPLRRARLRNRGSVIIGRSVDDVSRRRTFFSTRGRRHTSRSWNN